MTDLIENLKALLIICFAIAAIIFTITFSIMLAYKLVGAV